MQVFLDAIGEPRTSIRRNSLRGIQAHTQLNAGRPSEAIDVLLLDERYHRVPMPCHTRHRYCTDHTVHKGHNRKVRDARGPWGMLLMWLMSRRAHAS